MTRDRGLDGGAGDGAAGRRTRVKTTLILALAFSALGSTLPSLARAGEPDSAVEAPERRAARAFVEGQAAFEAGDFRRAGTAFEAAHAAKPHHASLWNAARSWHRAGESLREATLLDRYLHEAPADAPNRAEATAALAEVERRVGRVQIHIVGATDARLDGAPAAEGTTFVAPGEHIVVARDASGHPIRKVVAVREGQIVSITLAPEPVPPAPSPEPVKTEPDRGARVLPPWVVYGGGALAVVGGTLAVVSGLDTLDRRDAFLNDPSQARLDAGYESQARTNIAIGVTTGVAVLTLAAALFLVDWRSTPRPRSSALAAGRSWP